MPGLDKNNERYSNAVSNLTSIASENKRAYQAFGKYQDELISFSDIEKLQLLAATNLEGQSALSIDRDRKPDASELAGETLLSIVDGFEAGKLKEKTFLILKF